MPTTTAISNTCARNIEEFIEHYYNRRGCTRRSAIGRRRSSSRKPSRRSIEQCYTEILHQKR